MMGGDANIRVVGGEGVTNGRSKVVVPVEGPSSEIRNSDGGMVGAKSFGEIPSPTVLDINAGRVLSIFRRFGDELRSLSRSREGRGDSTSCRSFSTPGDKDCAVGAGFGVRIATIPENAGRGLSGGRLSEYGFWMMGGKHHRSHFANWALNSGHHKVVDCLAFSNDGYYSNVLDYSHPNLSFHPVSHPASHLSFCLSPSERPSVAQHPFVSVTIRSAVGLLVGLVSSSWLSQP
ncbi:hypothetical protein M378DRAFT_467275 [Amanita muscaria Koide BX008]|uniref:Uncharacterized protein n=1 Tax=Amanita muscaria (strain Koide BX008) TaxID=946122 RepID=A0A0C2S1M0_AMAMK|nr:hypothetical protein M378DRAFT_467275 [Amanita muscaria Koide BX008]